MKEYKPETCNQCGQSTTYLLSLDRGSIDLVLDILRAISNKGINEIHPAREMNIAPEKKWQLTNLSRPRFHGLIAYVRDKKGYYCLTKKAGKFFRGAPISRFAIISKAQGHQIGYWEPEIHQITLQEALKSDEIPWWSGDETKMIDQLDHQDEGQQTLL
jgi:hypothetical protein